MDVLRGLVSLVEFDKRHNFAIYAKGKVLEFYKDDGKLQITGTRSSYFKGQ